MKKVISTANAPAAIGPYSQAIETEQFLFTSGQIPINPVTDAVEADTIEGQAEQVMKNIGALLEEAGLDFSHVVKTTCFLADLNDFNAFNEVYAKYFPDAAPARSCFAVAGLPKGAKLEVETICVK